MPTLYIMVGVGFSGKSTLAQKIAEYLDIPLVSQDAIFHEIEDRHTFDNNNPEDKDKWRAVLDLSHERLSDFLSNGKSVVFDNVNLKLKHRNELRRIADKAGAKTVVIYLDTPEEILNKRQHDNKTTGERHDVKQKYLDDAKRQLEIPTADENTFVFTPETNLEDFLNKLSK